MPTSRSPWWQHAVFYEVYVRSFADGNGDGLGDLPGITGRLGHLRELGVDALWITPFYPSPQRDAGYDVADYSAVDPRFGTLADFDALVARAHELGLRVVIDIVPNHTSSEHAWFRAALAAPPGSRERERYVFRDGAGPAGERPPNNWLSVFGGPAWTRVTEPDGTTGQWYLHLFDTTQPDLNWRNPEVGDLFEEVLRFWLDRGVDGFRIDVAHALFKDPDLRDQQRVDDKAQAPQLIPEAGMVDPHEDDEPMWDQPEVHEVYRRWHRILAEYPQDPVTVAEAWTKTPASMARYVRPDELSQSFNFAWLTAPWSATAFSQVLSSTFAALAPVGALPTWVLSNHDVVRHPTRYGGAELGLARARAATLTMLGLPGSAYLYQGEELGLEQVEVAPAARQDPVWFRTGETGRDGCRVPLPWAGDRPPYAFSSAGGQPWLPQPADWATVTVATQDQDPASTLAFYREALRARRRLAAELPATVTMLNLGPDILAYSRGALTVVLNCGSEPVRLPAGEVLVSSWPITQDELPGNTAAWLRPGPFG